MVIFTQSEWSQIWKCFPGENKNDWRALAVRMNELGDTKRIRPKKNLATSTGFGPFESIGKIWPSGDKNVFRAAHIYAISQMKHVTLKRPIKRSKTTHRPGSPSQHPQKDASKVTHFVRLWRIASGARKRIYP